MGKMDNTKSRQGGGEWGINFYSHLADAYTGFPTFFTHLLHEVLAKWGLKKIKNSKGISKTKILNPVA
jgi:hypothetical protein